MTIAILHRPLSLTLATLGLISLVACGGGGGGGGNSSSSAPVVVDTTPNAISFAATENAEPNAQITSPAVTISGINAATPISISGGEYSIAGGAFTSTAGTISNGQSLAVRLAASDKTNTAKTVTVTVGGVSATFTVTTFADTTADAFSFTAVTGAEFNKEYTSEAVTISGVDVAVPVSITGGLYSINGGEFTSAAGTVSAGQTISLKATSGNNTDTTQSAVLSIGSISGTFAVTTIPDTTPPVAEFKFPTPYTMSEANSVKVRGTATDDHAITSVKIIVNGTTELQAIPKAPGDFSSWTADAPLATLSENEIKVVATDDRNNQTAIGAANKVKIRQAVIDSPGFPDGVNSFELNSGGLIYDKHQSGERLLVANPYEHKIIATDLITGLRSVFISVDSACDVSLIATDPVGQRLYGVCEDKLQEFNLADGSFIAEYDYSAIASGVSAMTIDRTNGRAQLVMIEYTSPYSNPLVGGAVIAFSLSDKKFSVIFAANEMPLLNGVNSVIVEGNRYLIINGGGSLDANLHSVLGIDTTTGKHNIISNNDVGSGESFSGGFVGSENIGIAGAVNHRPSNQFFVNEFTSGKLFSINLETGNRSVFKTFPVQRSTIFNEDILPRNRDITVDELSHILFIYDGSRRSIWVIDIQTGEQVILTKSENDY